VFSQRVRPLGAAKYVTLDENIFVRARWYVLINCKETVHTCSKCIIVGSLSDSLLFTHDTR
jgi:hypothetical protein